MLLIMVEIKISLSVSLLVLQTQTQTHTHTHTHKHVRDPQNSKKDQCTLNESSNVCISLKKRKPNQLIKQASEKRVRGKKKRQKN